MSGGDFVSAKCIPFLSAVASSRVCFEKIHISDQAYVPFLCFSFPALIMCSNVSATLLYSYICISVLYIQAADLLRHPLLRPYILDLHLKVNNPRRHTLAALSSNANFVKKTRFVEAEAVTKEKRLSCGNNRALNPSISGNELDSPCSSRRAHKSFSHLNDKLSDLSIDSVGDDMGVQKLATNATKFDAVKTPRMAPAKASANHRRQSTTPSRISNPGSTRELVSSNSAHHYLIFHSCLYILIALYILLASFRCRIPLLENLPKQHEDHLFRC